MELDFHCKINDWIKTRNDIKWYFTFQTIRLMLLDVQRTIIKYLQCDESELSAMKAAFVLVFSYRRVKSSSSESEMLLFINKQLKLFDRSLCQTLFTKVIINDVKLFQNVTCLEILQNPLPLCFYCCFVSREVFNRFAISTNLEVSSIENTFIFFQTKN